MTRARFVAYFLLMLPGINGVHAAVIELASSSRQATLLELYTSEGCSSCPPADRWFSEFRSDARLWREIVPVAFHVDYWNNLGWQDRFSDAAYSTRQHSYYRHRYLKSVYTPGLMANGREWRDWFGLRKLPALAAAEVGVLKAVIDSNSAMVEFVPTQLVQGSLRLNVAFLGFDQTTTVAAGENRGKALVHDFVVLDFHQFPQSNDNAHYRWTLEGLSSMQPHDASGIALWITAGDDPTPLQAIGGYLRQ